MSLLNPDLPEMLALLQQLAPQPDAEMRTMQAALQALPAIAADDPDADADWNHPVRRFAGADEAGNFTFRIDWKDTESCVLALQKLAARWGVSLGFGVANPLDDAFLDSVWVDTLLAQAQQELEPHGLGVWLWDTQGDEYLGWIARRDAQDFFADLQEKWQRRISLADSVVEENTALPGQNAAEPTPPHAAPRLPIKRLAFALFFISTMLLLGLYLLVDIFPPIASGGIWMNFLLSLVLNALTIGAASLLVVRWIGWRRQRWPDESEVRRMAISSMFFYAWVLIPAFLFGGGWSLFKLAMLLAAFLISGFVLYILTAVLLSMSVRFWQKSLG